MANCPTCGVDESSISVHDGVDAVRTFPGRYRRALDGLTADQVTSDPPGGWSVLAYVVHVGEVLERSGAALATVLDQPGAEISPLPDEARPPGLGTTDSASALDRIDRAAAGLVGAAAGVSGEAWTRPFTLGGVSHDAGWLVRHAAHEGAHHLREIAAAREVA